MKIIIKSNFVIPGLGEEEDLKLDQSEISLRAFLEELAQMSLDPIEYIEPGADRLDPDDWEVDINDIPYQNLGGGLEVNLKDGDIVTIKIMAQGGG